MPLISRLIDKYCFVDHFIELKQKYSELQDAHLKQSQHIQKLRAVVGKIDSYKKTIETQENVISKMQNVIESKIKTKNAIPSLVEKREPLPTAESITPSELVEAKQKIDHLEKKVKL